MNKPTIERLMKFSREAAEAKRTAEGGSDRRLVLPVRLGEHPTRYYSWKSHFSGWTQREEEIAHAAYIAGWYHRCNQDPDAMGENTQAQATQPAPIDDEN